MEQLSSREKGAENVSGASTVTDSNVAARRAITLMAALAVFGAARSSAEPQGRGKAKPKKPIAADSVYLSCPEQETTEVGGYEVAVPDECHDGRLEVRCPGAKVSAAWDIPSIPLPGGSGVSLPLRLLRGGSIFVRCEGDALDGGRMLDIPPATKFASAPQTDSVEVREHPEVRAAQIKYLVAKSRLVDAEKQMIRTGRDLLLARGKLDSAKKRFELEGATTTLIVVEGAEEEYVRVLGERQKAKTEYEAAQAAFDRSVEQFGAAVQHVSEGLKVEALRANPPRTESKDGPTVKASPPAVPKSKPSAPLRKTLSAGASHSLWSPDDFVSSPGFSLEGDIGGVFRKRPSVGLQIVASFARSSHPLSIKDPRFVPRDQNQRLGGSVATLSARVRKNFRLGRIGSVDADFRAAVGFGGILIHTERGVDVGVSRENGRDLADIPSSNTVRPITVAGTQIVLTRNRISGAIGVSDMLGVFPMQSRVGAPSRDGIFVDLSLEVLLGYEF